MFFPTFRDGENLTNNENEMKLISSSVLFPPSRFFVLSLSYCYTVFCKIVRRSCTYCISYHFIHFLFISVSFRSYVRKFLLLLAIVTVQCHYGEVNLVELYSRNVLSY